MINRNFKLFRLWKYEADTIGKSEFLLDSSLIETLEFDNDIFAAGKIFIFFSFVCLFDDVQFRYKPPMFVWCGDNRPKCLIFQTLRLKFSSTVIK